MLCLMLTVVTANPKHLANRNLYLRYSAGNPAVIIKDI